MRILTSVIGSHPVNNLETAIDAQLAEGIDVVTDGQTSGDMIQIFAGKIGGIELANGKYKIARELSWPASGITVRDQWLALSYLLQKKSRALLKGVVTGPYTLARACANNYYGSEEEAALALARVLNSELRELQHVIDVLQIDEPAFYFGVPDYAKPMFSDLVSGVDKEIILHAHANKNHDLQSEVRKVAELPVQVLSYDSATVPQVLSAIQRCAPEQHISLGCVRTDVSFLPKKSVVRRINRAISLLGPERIRYVTPDCGLRLKTPATANKIMQRVVAARNYVLSNSK